MTTVQDQVNATLAAQGATHLSDYTHTVIGLESGGDTNAQAGTSSASGLYQFTRGTWENVMPGVPFSEATNPERATEAFVRLTEQNRQALVSALGREPTGEELYMAHFAGIGVAPDVILASADTPLSSLFSATAMEANPHLARLGTAGNYRAWISEKYNGDNAGAMARMAGAPAQGGGGNMSGDGFTNDEYGRRAMEALQNGDMGGLLMLFIMSLFSGDGMMATLLGGAQPQTVPMTDSGQMAAPATQTQAPAQQTAQSVA